MNSEDKTFIREVLSGDFQPIPNRNFTQETVGKIMEETNHSAPVVYPGDFTFLIPQVVYVSLCVLFALAAACLSLFQWDFMKDVLPTMEAVSNVFTNPALMAVLCSSSLLYVLDFFLKKVFHSPNLTGHPRSNQTPLKG